MRKHIVLSAAKERFMQMNENLDLTTTEVNLVQKLLLGLCSGNTLVN